VEGLLTPLEEAIAVHRVVAAIILPALPASVRFRAYRQTVQDTSLLAWTVGQIRQWFSGSTALVHDDADSEWLSGIADAHAACLVRLPSLADAASQLNVIDQLGGRHLIRLHMESAFAPAAVFANAMMSHLTTSADFTRVTGLPSLVACELASASFLRRLVSADLPGLPRNVRRAADMLDGDRRLAPPGAACRVNTVSVERASGVRTCSLPSGIQLMSATDVALARATLRRSPTPGAHYLPLWREAELDARRASQHPVPVLPRVQRRRRRPHVLYVSEASAFSGAEQVLVNIVKHIPAGSHKVSALVAYEGVLTDRLAEAGASVICPNAPFGGSTLDHLSVIQQVIERVRPDVIHLNAHSGLPVLRAAAVTGIPVVFHVHVLTPDGIEPSLGAASAIICVSDAVRRGIERYPVPPEALHVIHNGIDSSFFEPSAVSREAARHQLGLPADGFIALKVARFADNKRYDVFLSALATVRRQRPDIHGLVVGERLDSAHAGIDVERLIHEQALSSAVTRLGFQHDMRLAYAASDLLVLCSEREPFATCVLEALAMARPVVLAKSGGISEIDPIGEVLRFVEPGDSADTASAILELAERPDEARRRGVAGRRLVSTRFGWQQNANRVMDIYRGVLGRS
jgi:glycosyltransferase involved in cell wall biosynthesis